MIFPQKTLYEHYFQFSNDNMLHKPVSTKTVDAYRQHSEDHARLLFLAGVQVSQDLMNELVRFYDRPLKSHQTEENPQKYVTMENNSKNNPDPYFAF